MLLRYEFQWQMALAGMRYGWPAGDTSLPNHETVGLRWLGSGKLQRRTKDEKEFLQKHWTAHAKEADEEFTKKIVLAGPRDLPNEHELLKALMDPRTNAAEVRRICRRSRYLKPCPGYPCPTSLYQYAEEVSRAKRYERYPSGGKQNRLSSEDKRVDYLSRALAGLSLPKPMRPATADDILRKMQHKRRCACWRCAIKRAEKTGWPR